MAAVDEAAEKMAEMKVGEGKVIFPGWYTMGLEWTDSVLAGSQFCSRNI